MPSHFRELHICTRALCAVAAAIALWPGVSVGAAERPAAYDRDVALYTAALAAAKPGQLRVPFGDVALSIEQIKTIRTRLLAGPDFVTPPALARKWPGGIVYYRFDPAQVTNNLITPGKIRQFRDSAAEWTAWGNVSFVESTAGQSNFITVQQDPSLGGGFSSSVGMAGGEQFLAFGPNAWNRGTICHEVGHALGLFHEQQRPDRDTYVSINWSNISLANQPNFAVVPDGVTRGAYDFLSVMHYARNALAVNPNIDTILLQPGFTQFADLIGRVVDRTLSKLDRSGLAQFYGNPATLPGAIVTNTKEGGAGSLRSALYYAFDRSTDVPPVPTTVAFHIPISDPGFAGGVFTVKPTFLLVAPGAGTTIDGSTQTAFTGDTNTAGPEIVLDGSSVEAQDIGLYAAGFVLREANCALKNLVINGFNEQGIRITGAAATANVVAGCYLGTDKAGAAAVPNASAGLSLLAGAHGNTIGGTAAAARNVISGNKIQGVAIADSGTTGNVLLGNYIGTNAAGNAAVPNGFFNPAGHVYFPGIAITDGAHDNTIGGSSAAARNLISGNAAYGIAISGSGTNGNLVQGNFVGTDVTGTLALGNGLADPPNFYLFAGVGVYGGAQANTIGGSTSGAGNLLSGNGAQGLLLADANTKFNLAQANLIGTNAAGTGALGNGYSGVGLFGGAQANTIGGSSAAARNIISGNHAQGLALFDPATSSNVIQGNFIGTNAAGTAAIANAFSGIELSDAPANTIGGAAGARNVISGNANYGLLLRGAGTTGNLIQGNTVGLNFAANAALPNAFSGLGLYSGAIANTIGGATSGASNLISGNGNDGIQVADAATLRNAVRGNSIFGNGGSGIALFNGGNSELVSPALDSAILDTALHLHGTLPAPSGLFRIEFFANPAPHPAGFTEGRTFLGGIDASGAGAVFDVALPAIVPAGYRITATATDANGNTSRFATARVVTSVDTDSDGMPDAYETAHGLNPNVNDAALDPDGDGLTSFQEFRAGTDPQSATSRFRIIAVSRTGQDSALSFSSIPGKTYRVEWKNDLTLPDWTLLQEQVLAIGTSTQVTDFGALDSPRRFYRASVQP